MGRNNQSTFSRQVCIVVSKIPKGKTMTYKEVAKAVGSPYAWRAVGNILKKNKNPNFPCYRVTKSDGRGGGYRWGKQKKIILLRKEGVKLKM